MAQTIWLLEQRAEGGEWTFSAREVFLKILTYGPSITDTFRSCLFFSLFGNLAYVRVLRLQLIKAFSATCNFFPSKSTHYANSASVLVAISRAPLYVALPPMNPLL